MGDTSPIRTLGDYSKPSHEGYRNTIELLEGNNVVPLRSDIIRLEKNALLLFQLSLRDQSRNWLKRLPAGSITTWEDLTTRFLAQFFLPGRTAKLHNDILIFQQHQGKSLTEAWSRFKDLLQKVISWHRSLAPTHLAPMQPTQVNKITSSYEIYSGPHDTQSCMENPEQAFGEYTSSRTDEVKGLVSNFMASQDAILSKFEADFKQQQSEMTNKIDIVLKAITDRIMGALSSETVKNSKLNVNSTTSALSAHSHPMEDPQCSS
nr:hypothetical protein [Tanacetum cinerariifolium]